MTSINPLNISVLHYKSVDSTNQKATELLRAGEAGNGTVVCADHQTQGKGQRGKEWASEQGSNLLFSIVLQPRQMKPEDQFLLSALASLAVQRTVAKTLEAYELNPQVKIKWPNDILISDKKVCGILIENSIQSNLVSSAIIGIGLNINQQEFENLPHATSLSLHVKNSLDKDAVQRQLLSDISAFYTLMGRDNSLLFELFRDHLFGLHAWMQLEINGSSEEYRILGIEDDGRLKVENRSFKTFSVHHHEVKWLDFS